MRKLILSLRETNFIFPYIFLRELLREKFSLNKPYASWVAYLKFRHGVPQYFSCIGHYTNFPLSSKDIVVFRMRGRVLIWIS